MRSTSNEPHTTSVTVDLSQLKPVPARRIGRYIAGGITLVLVVLLLKSVLTNPHMQWDVVRHYFFSVNIVLGLARTLELTAISMAIAIVFGVILAVMRLSDNAVMSSVSATYIWFFRGTPLLVQLIFWYNLSALYPKLSAPFLFSLSVNSIITPFTAAILGLALNEAAYMAEIVRGGLIAVDYGQREAARALGMPAMLILRRIVLPQAMRSILPVTGNQTIGMLKNTALVSVLAMPDLLYSAQIIYSSNFLTIPLLVVACIWYLIVTTVLSVGQYFIERRYARGSGSGTNVNPLITLFDLANRKVSRDDRAFSSTEERANV